jgi:hypothetical protein
MPYVAPTITDQSVQYPNRFTLTEISAGVYDIAPAFGTVTEAGTAVNKALLQPMADEVANTYKIGDTKNTLRTDLTDDWLLCDGSAVDFATYPDLAPLLIDAPPNGTWTSNTLTGGTQNLHGVAYGNGYWVTVGTSGTVYYKADTPDGTWTSNAQGATNLFAVTYANGYWVAVGQSGALYYKADNPVGAWTSNAQSSNTRRSVAYGNGYWVAVGDSGNLIYKADTPDGTWTSNTQGSSHLYSVVYANGYWVASGASGALYYKATNPTSAWTSNTQGAATNSFVAYGNGYWVIPGYYKASTPDSAWTSNAAITGVSGTYANGYWITVGSSGALKYKALTPDSTWTSNTQGSSDFYSLATGAGHRVAVGYLGTLRYKIPQLPTISIGAYTYIRGK